jgi:hypothetical protein
MNYGWDARRIRHSERSAAVLQLISDIWSWPRSEVPGCWPSRGIRTVHPVPQGLQLIVDGEKLTPREILEISIMSALPRKGVAGAITWKAPWPSKWPQSKSIKEMLLSFRGRFKRMKEFSDSSGGGCGRQPSKSLSPPAPSTESVISSQRRGIGAVFEEQARWTWPNRFKA